MQILLLLLLILQNLQVVPLNYHHREKRFVNLVKRDVRSSSIQNLNRHIKTYEVDQDLLLNPPNFVLIDSLLSTISKNRSKSSIREHTTWFVRRIPSNEYNEMARYDLIQHQFILHPQNNHSMTINAQTGQLKFIIHRNTLDLLSTEISIHAESGLSPGDAILHDIYRFIRLSTTSMNCTTNITVNLDESIEIECNIEYEFFKYEDLNAYQPAINLTFYLKQNNSIYLPIDQMDLNEIEDLPVNTNQTLNWKRSIRYRMKFTDKEENHREYACIVVPDSSKKDDLLQNNHRLCRTEIRIQNDNSSTVILSRFDQLDLIDILIIILIVFSGLLFLISFILFIAARQYHKKRLVQIKPENKSLAFPLSTNQIVSNNNEIPSQSFESYSSHHKPGCPKYLPPSDSNLLTSDLFTHTTIDNMKKIILPDIPEPSDLFDDQTYIHFYIPSKSENISIKKLH